MTCPGIKVIDFNAVNGFTLLLKLNPNALAVLNDNPIPLPVNKFNPDLSLITYNNQPLQDIHEFKSIREMNGLNDMLVDVQGKIDDLSKELKNTLEGTGDQTYDCPIKDLNLDDIINNVNNGNDTDFTTPESINNAEDGISGIDLSKNFVNYCNDSNHIDILDKIKIPDIADSLKQAKQKDYSCLFNDDALKNIMGKVQTDLQDQNDGIMEEIKEGDLITGVKDKLNDVKDIADNHNLNLPENYDDLQEQAPAPILPPNAIIDPNLINELEYSLGITLATFNSEDQIYLQIIDKKVEVTNISVGNKRLKIDQDIPLNDNFYIIFQTNGLIHNLYMIDNGNIYEDSVTAPRNLGIDYIGIDDKLRKHFCGLLLDVQIYTYIPNPIETLIKKNQLFNFPLGAIYFYDWYPTRINKNLVYPLPDLRPPVKMFTIPGFNKYQLEDNYYKFMSHGYLTQFYCSRTFKEKNLSLLFWLYPHDNNGVSTIMSDLKNKFYLYYDFNNSKFIFEYDNKTYSYDYLLQKEVWSLILLAFDGDNHSLKFKIMEIDKIHYNQITEISLVSSDLISLNNMADNNYHPYLSSMLTKKLDGSNYTQFFNCKFGTLAIFDYVLTDTEFFSIYNEQKIVIDMLKL